MTQKTPPFKKYPAYKDSGVDWLGEIPQHWEVRRFKYVASTQKGKLPNIITNNPDLNGPPYMSMEYLRGGEENQWVLDKDAIVIDSGEILLLWDGANAGEFIKSKKGVISSTVAYIKFYNISQSFAWYFSKVLETELRKKTIGMGIPHVDGKYLNNLHVILPPLSEQTAIATFLDEKTTKLDTAIAAQEKMISLLKEYQQIIIQNAVTKGLNPHVTLKHSGVEWLGEIPEHWEVKRLKYVLSTISNKLSSKDSLFKYIGLENVESWTGKLVESASETEGLANHFIQNDILFGKLRPYLAKVYLAEFEGICSTEFLVYRNENPEYFHKIMLSNSFINLVDSSTYGAKMPRANVDWIGNQLIPIPPLPEQKAIAAHIETQTTKIAKAIRLKQQQIEKLKEYKAVLINSTVGPPPV